MLNNVCALKVNNISKSFKETTALNSVSIDFAAGFMHGVIGPDGAGKTTLMRIILGLLKPNNGEIIFFRDGKNISFDSIRADIAYMPQQESLYPDLSIDEHLEFFRDLYGLDKQTYQQRREELLQIARLTEFVDRPAGKLSGGMYKKLGLICALLRSPRIILLDEPTNGVDPISRRELWDLLYKLSDEQILIIISTAYMDEAERCGCVHLLENGDLIGEGDPHAILEQEHLKNFDEYFLHRGHYDIS